MNDIELQGSKSPQSSDASVPQRQETIRGRLAMGIFVVFSIVVIAILLVAIFANESAGSMNFLLSILSSITGVFGFVLGFYFGQNQS